MDMNQGDMNRVGTNQVGTNLESFPEGMIPVDTGRDSEDRSGHTADYWDLTVDHTEDRMGRFADQLPRQWRLVPVVL